MPIDIKFDKPLNGKRDLRVLVCGGRKYNDWSTVALALDKLQETFGIVTVISGGATGGDTLAVRWGVEQEKDVQIYPADWTKGRSAGPQRNKRMLREGKPDMVLAFPGGRGTENMKALAREAGVPVAVVELS